MRFTYDPEVDILMVHLVDGETRAKRFARNVRVPDGGPILDLAEDGTVLGVEIMGAARRYGSATLAGMPLEEEVPISLAEAAERHGVSSDALKFAAQRGRLEAKKIGRNWTTTDEATRTYLAGRQHGGRREPIVETPGGAGGPPLYGDRVTSGRYLPPA